MLNGIDTGRYNNIDDALKTSGTRHEYSKPRTAHRWTTKCPLAAVPLPEGPASRQSGFDRLHLGQAIQMKVVTGQDADAVIRNIDSATEQLGGQVKSRNAANAEIPPEGMQRIADIRIGDGNVLRGASGTDVLAALKGRLITSTISTAHSPNTGTRSRTGQAGKVESIPAIRMVLSASMPMNSEVQTGLGQWDNHSHAAGKPDRHSGVSKERIANNNGNANTSAQKVLEPGKVIYRMGLPDGFKNRSRPGSCQPEWANRNHSRPDILQRMKVDSQQVDAQPGMDANYAGESTKYQPFDGPALTQMAPHHERSIGLTGRLLFHGSHGAPVDNNLAVRKLVQNNGNGTYDVTLYVPDRFGSLKPSQNRRHGYFRRRWRQTLYAKTGDQDERWAALLEKRLAMETGSYEEIRGSNINKHMHSTGAQTS